MALRTVFSVCVGFLIPISLTLAGPVDTHQTPPSQCTWQGQVYQAGEKFQPDPCTSCQCDQHGRTACVLSACRPPACVDMVRDPDHCCPVCPNGNNCRAPDGTIIPEGQEVIIENSRICRCEDTGLFKGREAVCGLVGPLPPDGQ